MGRRSSTIFKNISIRLKKEIFEINMFQTGTLQESVWFVGVKAITDKAEEAIGANHIGRIPRGPYP